tara:strand:- start:106 stop:315 length:210 start_codon:yes stop_codon:yes gene_type:complete
MSEESQTVTIDGKEYDFVELEDGQQYLVRQLRNVNSKISNAKFELDQLSAAQDMFSKMLLASVKEIESK